MNIPYWIDCCFVCSLTFFILSIIAFLQPTFPHPYVLFCVASGLLLVGALLALKESRTQSVR
ncbi:hypothetical protein IT401_00840 [Candidatus Nomurabacteria bacterium]|nr:hypothetical protein [Candidatus Nomurabacteria bacterium]